MSGTRPPRKSLKNLMINVAFDDVCFLFGCCVSLVKYRLRNLSPNLFLKLYHQINWFAAKPVMLSSFSY